MCQPFLLYPGVPSSGIAGRKPSINGTSISNLLCAKIAQRKNHSEVKITRKKFSTKYQKAASLTPPLNEISS